MDQPRPSAQPPTRFKSPLLVRARAQRNRWRLLKTDGEAVRVRCPARPPTAAHALCFGSNRLRDTAKAGKSYEPGAPAQAKGALMPRLLGVDAGEERIGLAI